MAENVKVYLTVCEDADEFMIGDLKMAPGFKGEVPIPLRRDGNVMEVDLSSLGLKPRLGDTDGLEVIAVHKCADSVTVFTIYDDPMKTARSACCQSSGGPVECNCYSPISCSC